MTEYDQRRDIYHEELALKETNWTLLGSFNLVWVEMIVQVALKYAQLIVVTIIMMFVNHYRSDTNQLSINRLYQWVQCISVL